MGFEQWRCCGVYSDPRADTNVVPPMLSECQAQIFFSKGHQVIVSLLLAKPD
jgi:hypothetical protein